MRGRRHYNEDFIKYLSNIIGLDSVTFTDQLEHMKDQMNLTEPDDSASITSTDSLIMRAVRYFWSLITPSQHQESGQDQDVPGQENQSRAQHYWRLLADHNEQKLKKFETNLIDVTTKLNREIIGEEPVPFVKNI